MTLRAADAVVARRAFTLLELMLALAISSLVCLTAVMMLDVMIAGTRTQFDTRSTTMRRNVAAARLGALTRGADRVLAHGDDHLVLWLGDVRANAAPDLSELRRIAWDATTLTVRSFEAPPELAPSDDPSFAFQDDFNVVTVGAAGSAVFPGRTVLNDVTEWQVTLDSTDAATARLLRLTIGLHDDIGEDAITVISAFRLAETLP